MATRASSVRWSEWIQGGSRLAMRINNRFSELASRLSWMRTWCVIPRKVPAVGFSAHSAQLEPTEPPVVPFKTYRSGEIGHSGYTSQETPGPRSAHRSRGPHAQPEEHRRDAAVRQAGDHHRCERIR